MKPLNTTSVTALSSLILLPAALDLGQARVYAMLMTTFAVVGSMAVAYATASFVIAVFRRKVIKK